MNSPAHLQLGIMQSHAITCTHMHSHAITCTRMHSPAHLQLGIMLVLAFSEPLLDEPRLRVLVQFVRGMIMAILGAELIEVRLAAHLMREVIKGHQWSSEVIGGHRRSSRSVWPFTEPEALVTALSSVFSSSVTTWLPVALTPSPDEGGHRRSSEVIKCHRRSSVALTPSHRRPWRPQSPFC